MFRESMKRMTFGRFNDSLFMEAATSYGLLSPSTAAGTANGVVLRAAGGVSAEASFAPKRLAISAQRKQKTPKNGQV